MKTSPGIWLPFGISAGNLRSGGMCWSVRASICFHMARNAGSLQPQRVINPGSAFPWNSALSKSCTKAQLIPWIYGLPGSIGWLRVDHQHGANSRNSDSSNWECGLGFIKQILEKSISVWKSRRYMVCLGDGSGSGTFGRVGILSRIRSGCSQGKYTAPGKELFQG